ncbi:hypothetical protein B0H15DRAFT_856658 [Mycena belliarum]|uniref:Uncharacterized protein n=1 Tax=Mycena belliarum TaxID=1033014 RepID=A0AAD6TYC6_9AGAR|nr:hypothetical protein B0H15DRAFT_856658 [Mycena belliae]
MPQRSGTPGRILSSCAKPPRSNAAANGSAPSLCWYRAERRRRAAPIPRLAPPLVAALRRTPSSPAFRMPPARPSRAHRAHPPAVNPVPRKSSAAATQDRPYVPDRRRQSTIVRFAHRRVRSPRRTACPPVRPRHDLPASAVRASPTASLSSRTSRLPPPHKPPPSRAAAARGSL